MLCLRFFAWMKSFLLNIRIPNNCLTISCLQIVMYNRLVGLYSSWNQFFVSTKHRQKYFLLASKIFLLVCLFVGKMGGNESYFLMKLVLISVCSNNGEVRMGERPFLILDKMGFCSIRSHKFPVFFITSPTFV